MTQITKIYAGIGSRETPKEKLFLMTSLAEQLAEQDWFLRSGGANGADTAFAKGSPVDKREIHIPWSGYNLISPSYSPGAIIPAFNPEIESIAAAHHPNWDNLSQGVKKLMMRNVTIILGEDLESYAKMIICWTPNGALQGGTAQGMRVAYGFDIPVFNLALEEDAPRLNAFVEELENAS